MDFSRQKKVLKWTATILKKKTIFGFTMKTIVALQSSWILSFNDNGKTKKTHSRHAGGWIESQHCVINALKINFLI